MHDREKDLIETVFDEQDNFIRYVRRKITDISDMDAEDIVADVVFNLYNKVSIEHQVESILAYAYRSIRNKITDYLRQSKTSIPLDKIDSASGLILAEVIPDPQANIEIELQNEEVRQQLYAALMELDAKQRAVWVATEMEGYTFKELAEKWGEPIGTLLSRKSRATKALKAKLKAAICEGVEDEIPQ
ncbi:RNA polymerase sigma factor [Sporomusa aerivorans]|uniref:RNA polymerase sigma factor n=1 Tax=Sporomusa aerivorans TaxID=204936 RepID=UPI00352A455F